jgi:hypothetical protein
LFSEPDEDSFGGLVYPSHKLNLSTLLLYVGLVDAYGIDPDGMMT